MREIDEIRRRGESEHEHDFSPWQVTGIRQAVGSSGSQELSRRCVACGLVQVRAIGRLADGGELDRVIREMEAEEP